MSINKLPPEMLAMALSDKRMSLSERIALRAVSTHWQDTIEQHVLKLITKLALNRKADDDDDVPRLPLKAELIPLLGRLFPALADLAVTNDIHVYQTLPPLLTTFSATLTTLKLKEKYMPRLADEHHWITNLARAINSLTALTSLELDNTSNQLLPRLVPTLPRLQKFHYDVPTVPVEHWQNITLGPLMRMTDLKVQHAITLDCAAAVADIVATFPSLQNLNLRFFTRNRPSRLTDMLRSLSTLEHLADLELDCNYSQDQLLSFDRPLTQLKKLTLQCSDQIEASQQLTSVLPSWFPTLEELNLHYNGLFPLTTTNLRNLTRWEHLSYLGFLGFCTLNEALSQPINRPLTNLKELEVRIADDYPDGQFCSSLAAWFPGLVKLDIHFHAGGTKTFQLSMLSGLATLEHLTKLSLHNLNYARRRFPMPSTTDKVLPRVKDFYVEFFPRLGSSFSVKRHICSVLAAWFPCLESLYIDIDICYHIKAPYTFYLTSSMLRHLARLKHLLELKVKIMYYSKKHLKVPSQTDRPLTCLKKLTLEITDSPAEFDGEHFCSTVAAWLPCLEEINIYRRRDTNLDDEDYAAYETAIAANRHYFANSIKLTFW